MSGASFWKGGGKRQGPSRPVSSIVPIWFARCQLDNHGNPISNLFNACIALRNDPAWAGKLCYDQMLCSVVLADSPVEDIDAFLVHEWLQDNGLRRLGLDPVREAIEIIGREHPFHPLRDRLKTLEWDGGLRTSSWMNKGLGTEDNEYYREIGARFLIAMVARVMQPGCKADYMLVLEGPQGAFKSQACEILARGYFSDTLPDLDVDPVRVSMHLRGKWLIEVSEFSAFERANRNRLKAFLTTKVEQYIPKFGRNEVIQPRQCLFIGTTNDDHWHRDATGARRFWPVKCGNIDLDWLRDNIDQLLAEAVDAFHRGADWWPHPAFEERLIKPMQEARFETDAWEPPVLEWLVGKTQVTLHDLAYGALELKIERITPRESRRLTAILRAAGWELVRIGTARLWKPKNR